MLAVAPRALETARPVAPEKLGRSAAHRLTWTSPPTVRENMSTDEEPVAKTANEQDHSDPWVYTDDLADDASAPEDTGKPARE
jgi:hypothetical protein